MRDLKAHINWDEVLELVPPLLRIRRDMRKNPTIKVFQQGRVNSIHNERYATYPCIFLELNPTSIIHFLSNFGIEGLDSTDEFILNPKSTRSRLGDIIYIFIRKILCFDYLFLEFIRLYGAQPSFKKKTLWCLISYIPTPLI